jgi:membrane protease subunit HflK
MSTGGSSRTGSSDGLMLSGDQNIVDVEFKLLYAVSDPKAFLFNLARPEDTLRQVAESAMREVVGRRPAQDIFRDNREVIAAEVQTIIQTVMDSFPSGIVRSIRSRSRTRRRRAKWPTPLTRCSAPSRTRTVSSRKPTSTPTRSSVRPAVKAAQLREEASAYKDRVVNEATGEAGRFLSVYEEYAKAPEVTRSRLYLETLEKVLGGSDKVIIEQNGGGAASCPICRCRKSARTQEAPTNGQSSSHYRRPSGRHRLHRLVVDLRRQRARAGNRRPLR